MTSHNSFEKFATPISIIVAGLLIGGGIVLSKMTPVSPSSQQDPQADAQVTTIDKKTVASFISDDRIVLGNKKAKNVIIEVSDPSCPFCHFAAGFNPELVEQTGQTQFKTVANGGTYTAPIPEIEKLVASGDAVYVYSFGNGHGAGLVAMQALYCANEQGKFWEVHNKLMTGAGYTLINNTVKNDITKSPLLVKFIGDAADPVAMQSCIDSKKYEASITRDTTEDSKLKFSGTPHFVVNGQIFRGAVDFNTIKSALK